MTKPPLIIALLVIGLFCEMPECDDYMIIADATMPRIVAKETKQ